MPNWVISRIQISGPEDKIKEFEDKVLDLSEGAEEVFSFKRIAPVPEELVNTISPNPKPKIVSVKGKDGEVSEVHLYPVFINEWEISKAIAAGETPPEGILCNNSTPEMSESLILKYGRSNWYDWQNFNWGTKWDANNSFYNREDRILQFETAWSCPGALIDKMIGMFPDLTFEGTFADEDFGSNAGYIEKGGAFNVDDRTEEAYEIASSLWGYQGYYDDEKEEWVFEEEDE